MVGMDDMQICDRKKIKNKK